MNEFIERIFHLFINRTDTYAVYLPSVFEGPELVYAVRNSHNFYARIGNPKEESLREKLGLPSELDEDVVKRHLEHAITIAIYQIHPKNISIKWICLDLDLYEYTRYQQLYKKIFQATEKEFDARSVLLEACSLGKNSFHIWAFFDPPVSAMVGRKIGERILLSTKAARLRGAELLPRRVSLSGNLFESYVRLPLGIKGGRQSCFLDPYTSTPLSNNCLFEVEGFRV